jgi:hypothetical protein
MKKIILITLVLAASTLALDVESAFEVSEYCNTIYDFKQEKFITKNSGWCNNFIELNAHSVAESKKGKWCLDTTWNASKWKFSFQVYSLVKPKERTVADVIIEILNKEHACKMEVI